ISPSATRVGGLDILGAAGAVRPNAEVKASSGFLGLNNGLTTSSADGSFIITLNEFSSANLTVKDNSTGEQSSMVLTNSLITRLTGIVKDTDNNPLPGATVYLAGSTVSVLSDASGVFNLPDVNTGDQTLVVDGSTIPQAVTGPTRKFSISKITISI